MYCNLEENILVLRHTLKYLGVKEQGWYLLLILKRLETIVLKSLERNFFMWRKNDTANLVKFSNFRIWVKIIRSSVFSSCNFNINLKSFQNKRWPNPPLPTKVKTNSIVVEMKSTMVSIAKRNNVGKKSEKCSHKTGERYKKEKNT